MTALWTLLGIVVFVIGLLFSIAWHEAGHLATGKLFGVRVPQYMVGFGRTIWSKKIGETEYGLKAIPAGGYCRLIGMFPPGADGKIQARSTSAFRSMIEDARAQSYEEVGPGDEKRMFYTRKPWQRVIIMLAGPFMNLILAVVLFLTVFMAFGWRETTTTVSTVSECVVPATAQVEKCPAGAKPSPAMAAGLKAGDKIVSFNGQKVTSYEPLQKLIRGNTGEVTIVVDRGGQLLTLKPVLEKNQVAKLDKFGDPVKNQTVTTGFLGFSPAGVMEKQSFGESVDLMGENVERGIDGLLKLPQKIPALWGAAFQGDERDKDSPVGMVGAARAGGEVFSYDIPASSKLATMVLLLAGINLSLFLFNMLPLLPLDGGHVVGAVWESIRRKTARVFRRPDPGPFDVAKLMPVAYVVAAVFVAFTVLVLIADVFNPVKLT